MLQQPLFSIIGWVIFCQLWAAHLMKQRRKPMNKKLAQPSCYMLTIFLPFLYTLTFLNIPFSSPIPRRSSSSSVHSHFCPLSVSISVRRALAWQQNAWELPSSPCDDPGELSLIFECLKRGQGSREVIYSFRRIQRGLTCSWQVFIYTFSPLLTRLQFSSLLSLLGEQNALASPWKYIVHLRRRRLTKNKLDSFSPPILNSCIIYIPCLWLFNYAITAVVLLHRDILKSTHKITIETSFQLSQSAWHWQEALPLAAEERSKCPEPSFLSLLITFLSFPWLISFWKG